MTIRLRDVCAAIEEWAPIAWAYEWDRPGLSIGDPGASVKRVLVCLTVTPAAAHAAIQAKADLIVSHHPLVWEPFKALRLDDPHTRLCLDLARRKIACYAAHTNLDVAPGGVNDTLADRIGLQSRRPLLPVKHAAQGKLVTFVPETHLARVRDAVSEAGAGIIGEYTHCSFSAPGTGTFRPSGRANPFSGRKGRVNEEPERRFETLVAKARLPQVLKALFASHPYEEVAYDIVPLENRNPHLGMGGCGDLPRPMSLRNFGRHVRTVLKLKEVRVIGDARKRIVRLAVLGGSGGNEIPGIAEDIDALVTGDVKYHDALAAQQRNLAVIDAGHYGTERPIVPILVRYLRKHFRDLSVRAFAESDPTWILTD